MIEAHAGRIDGARIGPTTGELRPAIAKILAIWDRKGVQYRLQCRRGRTVSASRRGLPSQAEIWHSVDRCWLRRNQAQSFLRNEEERLVLAVIGYRGTAGSPNCADDVILP